MTNQNATDKAASDAANLLLRLGLGVAFVAAPFALLLSQRSIFILAPIAGALTFAAGLVLMPRMALRDVFAPLFSRLGLAALFLAFWTVASLLWTPFPGEAAPRLVKILSTFLSVAPVAAALPARSKAANLYLLPLGVSLAALAAIFIDARLSPETDEADDMDNLIRGVDVVLLLLWPALAATALRNRITLSAGLAIVVLASAISIRAPTALAATGVAALAFTAANADVRRTGRWIGAFGAASFIFAPLVPLLLGPLFGEGAPRLLLSLRTWSGMIASDGLRVVPGHGFNFVGSGVRLGYLPPTAPHSILFEAWTDLGLIGALAGAALVYLAYETAAAQSPRLAPFWLAGLTYVTAMGVLGGATLQLWWLTALALALGAFALAARGDFKTERPTAPKRLAI